ncbi:hypothetical protein HC891_10345 [Candidatus Gracilibacteria bacterium]|nr:hypothetical protein [Candidatus Gracilibacteria bacterium]
MRFRFRPEPLEVEPGETRASNLHVRLRVGRAFGQPKTYPLRITAQPGDDSAPAQSADARLVQRPPLPPWLLLLLAILTLLFTVGLCITTYVAALAPIVNPPVQTAWAGWFGRPSPTPDLAQTQTALVSVPTPAPTVATSTLHGTLARSATDRAAASAGGRCADCDHQYSASPARADRHSARTARNHHCPGDGAASSARYRCGLRPAGRQPERGALSDQRQRDRAAGYGLLPVSRTGDS